MNNYSLIYCNKPNNPEWDTFVNKTDGDIVQTSAWAAYEQQSKGWESFRFYYKLNDEIVGGCQIYIIDIGRVGKIGYAFRGPCILLPNTELHQKILDEIKTVSKKKKFRYLSINCDYREKEFASQLKTNGFVEKIIEFPPRRRYRADCTLFINLKPSLDDILNQMKTMRKRNIRKGLKSSFEIKTGERNDLNIFHELMLHTARKHNAPPIFRTLDELYNLWDALSPVDLIILHLGVVDGEVICGAMSFPFGKTFRYYEWGWNEKYPELNIPSVIQWKLIQWAKEHGFEQYDFMELDPVSTEALQSPENPVSDNIKERFFYGPTLFKMLFGGEVIKYPEGYTFYPGTLVYLLVHKLGHYFLVRLSLIKRLRRMMGRE